MDQFNNNLLCRMMHIYLFGASGYALLVMTIMILWVRGYFEGKSGKGSVPEEEELWPAPLVLPAGEEDRDTKGWQTKEGTIDMRGDTKNCDYCSKKGHLAYNCKQRPGYEQRPIRRCFNCDQEGHMVKYCPKKKWQKRT